MPIPLRFAFQGGGAKFVTLLAAAKAVYDLKQHHVVTIDHVSGTSAGAIAAGILAAGIDPGVIRANLQDTGTKHLTSVMRSRRLIQIAYRLFLAGMPLYDYQGLLAFMKALLAAGGKQANLPLHDCAHSLSIIASDLSKQQPHVYQYVVGTTKSDETSVSLATAIANSCSLPIIFKNTRGVSDNHLVDGGIIENLPVRCLVDGFEKSRVVAFSFEAPSEEPDIVTIKDYALCLIDTSITANIAASYRLLAESNIISLPFSYKTMDFERALNQGLGEHFHRVYETVTREVSAIADRESELQDRAAHNTRLSRAINVRKSAQDLFELLETNVSVDAFSLDTQIESFPERGGRRKNDLDTYTKCYEISFDPTNKYAAFRVFLVSSEGAIDLTLSNIDVIDSQDRRIEFIPLVGDPFFILEDDVYSIPIYIFINTEQFGPGRQSIKVKHVDRVEKSLKKIHAAEPGETVVEPFGGKAAATRQAVEWKLHLPHSVMPHIAIRDLTVLGKIDGCLGIADGNRIDDFPDAKVGFQTIRWISKGPVEKDWGNGFEIVYTRPKY